jgi:hypothetical protein
MRRSGAPLVLAFSAFVLCFVTAPAAAQQMQPGLWRFTQSTQAGGRSGGKTMMRCVSAAQAQRPAAYFTPRGRGCVVLSNSNWASRLTSTVRCKIGDRTSEVNSTVRISSPTSISVSTTMTASAGGRSGTIRMTGAGERVGDCGGGRRKMRRARR